MSARARQSAGLLLYRGNGAGLEVFLVHPGGPFWAKRDLGAWSIPKGEYLEDEEPLAAALREFQEETGFGEIGTVDRSKFMALGSIRQKGGKIVSAWGVKFDVDAGKAVSNFCEIEWPPRTGRRIEVPEVDRAAWYSIDEARGRIFEAQAPFLERLMEAIAKRV